MLPIPLWTKPEFGNLLSNPPKGQWHVQICAVEFYFSTFSGGCCMAVTHLFHKSQLDQTERVETHRDLDHHMLVCFHPIPKNGNQSGIIITRITRMVRNNTCWKHQQDQWTSQVVENLCFFIPHVSRSNLLALLVIDGYWLQTHSACPLRHRTLQWWFWIHLRLWKIGSRWYSRGKLLTICQ